jgi:hypothetical protein
MLWLGTKTICLKQPQHFIKGGRGVFKLILGNVVFCDLFRKKGFAKAKRSRKCYRWGEKVNPLFRVESLFRTSLFVETEVTLYVKCEFSYVVALRERERRAQKAWRASLEGFSGVLRE